MRAVCGLEPDPEADPVAVAVQAEVEEADVVGA